MDNLFVGKHTALPRGVVGIGASAGGLEALQQLLHYLPETTDLAFVIVQHLSPDYKSLLKEILSKYTKMPVHQAKDGMLVEKNNIYLIPPKFNMEIDGQEIHLSEYDHGIINHPVDIFFRSLARSYGHKSVAVILSGTGSDGTNGIKTIKEENGLIIVQSPESSKFDGMPRSAIGTGFADLVLPPEAIAAEMTHISKSFFARSNEHGEGLKPTDETMLTKIFAILKSITNVNYTYYKQTTILRRIERRMVVNHKTNLEKYVDYLAANPEEARLLSREVLIGVTSFFRDPEYFELLKANAIKSLLSNSKDTEPVRVWIAGCSTGEEAYSVAILFMEVLEELNLRREIKIFATDLDAESIAFAGRGIYGENIAEDVSISRLSKFFTKKKNSYIVNHDLRKMIIFSPHNVFQDPPFGRLDLICCRNLLIYFQPVLQKDLFNIFHMALKDNGYLFLGKSEAINGQYDDVFKVVCAQEKIFIHNAQGHAPVATPGYTLPALSGGGFLRDPHVQPVETEEKGNELYLKTLELFMPSCILVNEKNQIKHLFGDCSNFIHMPAGNFTSDVFSLITPDLRIAVSTALKASREQKRRITYTNISVAGEKSGCKLALTAAPLNTRSGEASGLTAIVLITDKALENKLAGEGVRYDIDRIAAQRIADLEQELNKTQDNLKHTITELESVNEELQAANEELLTANEELQSSNEELQSVNEELYTVNSEYQQKANELTGLNDDMNNFLSTTLIGIIFIDDKFRIRKFTNYVMKEFNVLPQDEGRPLQYIAYNFVNTDLLSLSKQVAATQSPVECDIVSVNGKPYFLRIAPYRTEENKVLGLVMTFVDVSRQYNDEKQMASMEQALEHAKSINVQKDSFMSRMSHDMRTPLHTIQGLVYLSLELPNLDKLVRGNLLKIQDASQFLLGILSDILDSNMIDSNRVKLKEEAVWEDSFFQEVEDMVLLQAERQKVSFARNIKGNKNRCLLMDKTHVLQILVNLLTNAIKFTPEKGKIEFSTEIKEIGKNHIQHIYEISDTGCGMSKDFLEKMYLPFEQGNNEQHKVAHGVGLGLHIAHQLVELLGGTIDCQSKLGVGTTFTVKLTYSLATEEQQKALQETVRDDYNLLQDKSILLVDDHEINRMITKAILTDKGMKVTCAANGQEAVQRYMESALNEFSAILMDIRMPLMDGLQATMKIRSCSRADAKNIPIIALTANALDEEEKVCLNAGMNARLLKPLNTVELYKTLLNFISKKS